MRPNFETIQDVEKFEQIDWQDRISAKTGYETFRQVAEDAPDRIAITARAPGGVDATTRNVSYGQLLSDINRCANLFQSRGLRRDEAVTHLLPLLPETYALAFAAETVGILNPVNPMLEVEHLIGITKAANSRILVIPGPAFSVEVYTKGMEIAAGNPTIHSVFVLGGSDDCDGAKVVDFLPALAAHDGSGIAGEISTGLDDVVAYYHTGGTTGLPKLAQHTQQMRVVQNVSNGALLGLDSEECVLQGLPMFHTAGCIIIGMFPLMHGARLLLLSPVGYRDPTAGADIWKIIEREKVTILTAVPTVFVGLLNVPVGNADLSSLRVVLTGGAPTPPSLLDQLDEKLGCKACEGFGMTEMGGMCNIQTPEMEHIRGSVGLRGPYIGVRVADDTEHGPGTSSAPIGHIGTLCYGGPCVMPGYADGRAQHETFTSDGWLNTGDLAREVAPGEVAIVGRAKDMIIRSGHNIDPVVIEDVLFEHPAVELTAAVGLPDPYAGELPMAYVKLHDGAKASAEELNEFARTHISERAATPVEIVVIDQMPKTAFDKIFKPALRNSATQMVYDRLVREALSGDASHKVTVETDPECGTMAFVELGCGPDPEMAAKINKVLCPFKVGYELVWAS